MSFANPGLLLYLIPLAGIIIFLYFLKMRRKDFKVPAAFLWPASTTDVRANAPLQRIKFSWLLVLQIIAIALIVASLARPQTRQEGLAGNITIFVVDTSASMSARDVGKTRLEEAVARIQTAVSTARPGDRFSLVEAGPTPRVALPLSGDIARMRSALESLQPTDAKADVGGAMRLAAALVGALDSGHIVLLSDGAFPEIENFSQGKAAVHFQQIGSSAENLGITAIGTGNLQVYCGVRNFGKEPREATISLYADGEVFESKKATIASGSLFGLTAKLPTSAGVIEARIEPDDLLMSDNRAYTLASPGASLRVLLITTGNIFLERALSLDPRVTLEKATAVPDSEIEGHPGTGVYDVVVFDDTPEADVKARGVLSFGSPRTQLAAVSGTAASPTVTSSDREHNIVKHVDFSSTYIGSTQRFIPEQGATSIVDSDKGPLIVVSDVQKRHVAVAFSLLDSDFALQVGFPIFIGNVLDFMAVQATTGASAVQTGRTISAVAESDSAASITLPDGETQSIDADSGSYIIRHLNRAGKYVLNANGKQSVIYANLLDETESKIEPADSLKVDSRDVTASKAPARIADFWKPILLFCLIVLACEWWLFAKKS